MFSSNVLWIQLCRVICNLEPSIFKVKPFCICNVASHLGSVKHVKCWFSVGTRNSCLGSLFTWVMNLSVQEMGKIMKSPWDLEMRFWADLCKRRKARRTPSSPPSTPADSTPFGGGWITPTPLWRLWCCRECCLPSHYALLGVWPEDTGVLPRWFSNLETRKKSLFSVMIMVQSLALVGPWGNFQKDWRRGWEARRWRTVPGVFVWSLTCSCALVHLQWGLVLWILLYFSRNWLELYFYYFPLRVWECSSRDWVQAS